MVDITENYQNIPRIYEIVKFLAKNLLEIVLIVDNNFNIEFYNNGKQGYVLGWKNKNLIGNSLLNLIREFKNAQENERKLIESLRSEPISLALNLKDNKENLFTLNLNGISLIDNKEVKKILLIGKIIQMNDFSIRDVNHLNYIENHWDHQIKETLEQELNKLRVTLDDTNDIVIFINENGKIINVNKKCLEILGYTREHLLQMNLMSLISPEKINLFKTSLKKTKNKGIYLFEIPLIDKYNRIHIFESRSLVLYINQELLFLIIGRNITKRIEELLELKESEFKYRSILENIIEGYYEIDLNGNFIFSNDALLNIFHCTKDQLKNMNLFDLCDKSYRDFLKNAIYFVRAKKSHLKSVQIQVNLKNSSKIFLEMSIDLKMDENGDIIGYHGLIRDITEQKKAELLEKKFKEELEKEVELRTKELNQALELQKCFLDELAKSSQFKTEFISSISHELRTPLNAIIGFTDLLLEQSYGRLNDEQLGFLNDIKLSAMHQLEMINNILDVAKIESGKMTLNLNTFSFNTFINQMISSLKPLCDEKKLYIKVEGLIKEIEITADPIKFKEIFYNLLSNAIKFTLKGGITIFFEETKDDWIFKVKDTGIGIAEEDYPKIFKEFERGSNPLVNSIEGSGLGLSLTKRLVNLHGGTISFNSKVGVGTTFTFTIPKSHSKKKIIEDFFSSF
ncbi:MAG: PAS domain-containing sensor histidine kinase [Promethearchaeota archaeon]